MNEILTEQQNKNTLNIDILEPLEVLKLINDEDIKVAKIVKKCLKDIALGVNFIENSFVNGADYYILEQEQAEDLEF